MSPIVHEHDEHRLSYGKYIFGFLASVALTLVAYFLVTMGTAAKDVIIGLISGLAIVQFLVQMLFFLHLGEERQPRWKLLVAVFMLGIVLIVVFGSIWIMNSLNYRMMTSPEKQAQYLHSQDSL